MVGVTSKHSSDSIVCSFVWRVKHWQNVFVFSCQSSW